MFMQLFFSKVHPACHNIANGIKPGCDSKKTDKHAVDFKSCMLERKLIYVRCINCSYNNEAKGTCLLVKKKFLLYRNDHMQVRDFERYILLK